MRWTHFIWNLAFRISLAGAVLMGATQVISVIQTEFEAGQTIQARAVLVAIMWGAIALVFAALLFKEMADRKKKAKGHDSPP